MSAPGATACRVGKPRMRMPGSKLSSQPLNDFAVCTLTAPPPLAARVVPPHLSINPWNPERQCASLLSALQSVHTFPILQNVLPLIP